MKVAGNYPGVSADWVKKQIDNNANMALIDSRPKRKKYDKGHIPTALSIPDSQFAKMQDLLPADKATPLVFYCGGLKCRLSHKSAKKAIELGYTKVKVFADGYPAWVAAFGKGDTTVAASAKSAAGTPVRSSAPIVTRGFWPGQGRASRRTPSPRASCASPRALFFF